MKKYAIFLFFLSLNILSVAAQAVDRSQYQLITLDEFLFLRDIGETAGKKFSILVYYNDTLSSGATLHFRYGGNHIHGRINRRYTIEDRQLVTVFFTCGGRPPIIIDDIAIGNVTLTQARPWHSFILNNRTGLRGWFLEYLGNGTYREIFFE